ncbi:MAG: tetratricopeptide repeat protein [Chitinivibrionales bacterium]|nr:tetratricopeptide repeat protein [Chitinivibrionales bacterium]
MKSSRAGTSASLLAVLWIICLAFAVWADGLPGEYLVTQRWRDLATIHSPLTNPAFLTEENYKTARVIEALSMHNTFQMTEAGITIPIGLYQSYGLTYAGEFAGTIDEGIYNQATNSIDPTGRTLSNVDNFLMFTYAINPWDRLSVGASLTMAYQTAFGQPKMGIGGDLGVSYRLLHNPLWGDHIIGLSALNLIAPTPAQTIFSPTAGEDSYARDLKLSWIGTFWNNQIESGLDLNLKDFLPSKVDFPSASSVLENDVNFRLGGWIFRMLKAYFQVGPQYWAVSGGVNLPVINNGRDFSLMYQYTTMLKSTDATMHSIYFRTEFGLHREEEFAKLMARGLNLSPNDLYNRALTLYSNGNYWEAYFVFAQILEQFPDFFKNDWVNFYRGSCFEELDMRTSAVAAYQQTCKQYPRSSSVPNANLGLMRIAYRENDMTEVTRQFGLLATPETPDSIKFHADYIMGEANFRLQNNYAGAAKYFGQIPDTHPAFIFAQHSLGVASFIQGDNYTKAMEAFSAVFRGTATTASQKEIVNRTYLMVGFIYYQQQELGKAVFALRQVPPTSYYYQDALLGLGWSAVKSRQWVDCEQSGATLAKVSKITTNQCEGMLLQAYSLLINKKFADAEELLKSALAMIKNPGFPTADTLTARQNKYFENRVLYDDLAKSVAAIAQSAPSEPVLKIIDSMHTVQKSDKAAIDAYLTFVDNTNRQLFFGHSIAKIKEDIEYSLASVEKYLNQGKAAKPAIQSREKLDKIDDQIEKLKEQMKKLDEKTK